MRTAASSRCAGAVAFAALLAGCGASQGTHESSGRAPTLPSATTAAPQPSAAPELSSPADPTRTFSPAPSAVRTTKTQPTTTPTIPTPRPSATPAPASTPAIRLAGTDWTRIPTSSRVVALTFDAGANAAGVASIVRTLEDQRVPGTFFLTGSWVRTFPQQAREIASRYPVGNHTLSHPMLTKLSDVQVRAQVSQAESAIVDVTGRTARPLFRFPYGDADARVLRDVNELGYVAVRWTVDTLGWKGTSGGMTAAAVRGRVLRGARPGMIVLMHVGSHPQDRTTLDADALPEVITQLRARGYTFVTLRVLTG